MSGRRSRVPSGGSRPARKAKVGWERAVTYRIYPTPNQAQALGELLGSQRELYNAALEERRGAWRVEQRSVSKFDQYRQLTGDRVGFEWLARFGVGVARGTLTRLDEAFRHFFRRVAAGETPGFPRFKGAGHWDSVQWEGTIGWRLHHDGHRSYGRLSLQGVGHIKIKVHRIFGDGAEARKLVVRRRGGRWEAIVCWRGVQIPTLAATGRACGIDVGVTVLAAVADDQDHVQLIDNPRLFQAIHQKLVAAQQALAACAKTGRRDGGGRRSRAKAKVTRVHAQARQVRRNLAHQVSARLVRDFDLIACEDLHIAAMTRSARRTLEAPGSNVAAKAGLNRSILDAGWGQLVRCITYKAASAGRQVQRVPAAHTSQTCARCGHTEPGNRVTRDHFACIACRHQAHADANAAQVVLARALGRLPPTATRGAHSYRPEPGHQPATTGRDAVPRCGS